MADPNRPFRRVTPDFAPPGSSPGLRPAANGNFNYAPPPREQSFADALKSLSAVEPEIERILGNMEKRGAEQDKLKGQQKALELALSDAEAIKQGKLSPGESKWFMRGYKEQYWRTQSITWANEAREAWAQSPEKNSDDPAAAQKFLAKFFDDRLKGINDPVAREASLPIINKTYDAIIGAQSEYRSQRVYTDHLANVGGEISQIIDDLRAGRIDPAAAQERIKALDTKSVKLMGVKPDDFNATLAKAIASKARQYGDTRILDLAKAYPHIGNNPKYMDTFRAADDAILSRAASMESLQWTREQRARAAATRQWLAAGYEYIAREKKLPSEEDMAKLRRVNPEIDTALRTYHRNLVEDGRKDDPLQVAFATAEILRTDPDKAVDAAVEMLKSGQIKGSGAARILDTAKMVAGDSLTKKAIYRDAAARIEKFSSKDAMGPNFIDPKWTQEAVARYTAELIDWRKAHPGATEQDLNRASQEMERRWTDWATTNGASVSADPRTTPSPGQQPAAPAQPKPTAAPDTRIPTAPFDPKNLTDDQLKDMYRRLKGAPQKQ